MKKKERDAVLHETDMDTTVRATDPQLDEQSEKSNLNRRTFGKGLFGGVLATVVRISAPAAAVTGTLALEQKASASTVSSGAPYTPNGQTLQPVASDGVKRVTLTCQKSPASTAQR